MSTKLVSGLVQQTNLTTTTNGAVALKSTGSGLVDLFGKIGALRNVAEQEVETAFIKAFGEDALLATKMAFYARDIRFGGLGERRTFRTVMKFLAKVHPDVLRKNIENIPHFGRWDDLYELIGTSVEADALTLIKRQWIKDVAGMQSKQPISVMAKWLKSTNTSSPLSRKLGKLTAKTLGLSERNYRKGLSRLRAYIDIVERKMSSGEWTDIQYSSVPSRAMKIYRKAFSKRDQEGFGSYIESVKKGEAKINAATLFPYDILEGMGLSVGIKTLQFRNYDEVLEQQWKTLPNYVDGENNVVIMADTSGSMSGRPIATAVGLAIYFAERNQGPFHNVFMTFSKTPSLVEITGTTLYEKIQAIPAIVSNTDFEKALDLILEVAIQNQLTADEMPKSLVVISDMQFDSPSANVNRGWTFYDTMRDKFAQAGYEIPNIVFWNVNNLNGDTFQVTSNYKGVQLASGQGVGTFKSVLANIGMTPFEAMVNTLSDPAYDCVVI